MRVIRVQIALNFFPVCRYFGLFWRSRRRCTRCHGVRWRRTRSLYCGRCYTPRRRAGWQFRLHRNAGHFRRHFSWTARICRFSADICRCGRRFAGRCNGWFSLWLRIVGGFRWTLARGFLRRGLRLWFCRWRRRNNLRDLVFLDEHKTKVRLDLEHIVFVRHDYAVQLLAVFELNFIRPGGWRHRGKRHRECRNQEGATLMGDSHRESIPPPRTGCNVHSPRGVRRATSASSARILAKCRSNSSTAVLSRARSGSGNRACVCCSASAWAII